MYNFDIFRATVGYFEDLDLSPSKISHNDNKYYTAHNDNKYYTAHNDNKYILPTIQTYRIFERSTLI